METLIFQLHAPLASWGETAVGEYRPSAEYPSQSAIQGLLGAALGINRDDDAAQVALRASYCMAVGVLSQGRLLRDYHTAQVPSRSDLKKRPKATRRDELSLPKYELNTILSTRDYRQDSAALIAIQAKAGASYSLIALANALKIPKYVLYLGRKSCPIAVPLHPCIELESAVNRAFSDYLLKINLLWESKSLKVDEPRHKVQKIAWGDDFPADAIGVQSDLNVIRKDQVITRQGWQFADRREHIAILAKE